MFFHGDHYTEDGAEPMDQEEPAAPEEVTAVSADHDMARITDRVPAAPADPSAPDGDAMESLRQAVESQLQLAGTCR